MLCFALHFVRGITTGMAKLLKVVLIKDDKGMRVH